MKSDDSPGYGFPIQTTSTSESFNNFPHWPLNTSEHSPLNHHKLTNSVQQIKTRLFLCPKSNQINLMWGQKNSVEEQAQQEAGSKQNISTLKMEATCSRETSVDFRLTTRHYIPEHRTLHNHRCENLKSFARWNNCGILRRQINYSITYCRPINSDGRKRSVRFRVHTAVTTKSRLSSRTRSRVGR
jgi:hypothetical protein